MPSSEPIATEVVEATDEAIGRAAFLLGQGRLVAVPTETVYGLAADAADAQAVGRVFAAKGRPADHPLIVHLADAERMGAWAAALPPEALALAEAFWPGPLTLVVERHPSVLDAVTGGRPTVALRVPDHPVARALLQAFGGGLAAPSANRFGRVSPTVAADVLAELDGTVDLILDGGPCTVGVESTIVEVVGGSVGVLRPGGIDTAALAEVLGRPVGEAGGPARAPGMLASHYAPRTPVVLCGEAVVAATVAELAAGGARVGVVSLAPVAAPAATAAWDAGGDVAAYARSLYRWLRQADGDGLDVLVAVPPPAAGIGAAVADRLRRAAHR